MHHLKVLYLKGERQRRMREMKIKLITKTNSKTDLNKYTKAKINKKREKENKK